MEVDAAPAGDADEAVVPPAGDGVLRRRVPLSRGLGLVAVVVAAVLTLLLVASLVLALAYLRPDVRSAHQLDQARADAQRAAEQFALRMDAFNGADLESYIKSVEPLLTDKEKTVFTQQLQQFSRFYEQVRKASKVKDKGASSGRVVLAGVSDIDSDSATVLVAHDSTLPGSSTALHSRWTVSMRKIDGRWLVDSFATVQ